MRLGGFLKMEIRWYAKSKQMLMVAPLIIRLLTFEERLDGEL